MAAALSRGASWGMGEDASAPGEINESSSASLLDWRSYSATHVCHAPGGA